MLSSTSVRILKKGRIDERIDDGDKYEDKLSANLAVKVSAPVGGELRRFTVVFAAAHS